MSKRLRESMEVISGVYEITNKINNHKYVGSSKDIYGRWVQHKRDLKHKRHHCHHLQRAWDLYDEKNFEFNIIQKTPDTIKDRFEREQYWYDYYKDNNFILYNESSIVATPCVRTTIEDLKNGKRKTSYEQFVQICDLLQNTRLPFYEIANITSSCINQVYLIYTRVYFEDITSDMVFQIRTNNGENSVSAKLSESSVKSIITEMLEGAYTVDLAKKYHVSASTIDDIRNHRSWTYLTDNIVFNHPKKVGNNGKSVVQYDMDGNYIAEYCNMHQAEKETGIGYKMISRVCNEKRPYTHGFIFKFKTQQND